MERIVECVPNFSEGRDSAVLDSISAAIRSVDRVQLLDIDPGFDTNRTVMTFVGDPPAVVEAAFQAIKTAAKHIDMRKHRGAHPRMGATDVCPLIPIEGIGIDECVRLAEQLGERVAMELGIPVYLYEHAARSQQRRHLSDIRAGEYEGLARKMADAAWAPDYGGEFNAKSGATVIGVREFLIAYNVNLNTTDKRRAHDIALSIRETGRLKRDDEGRIIRDADGKSVREPGLLTHVKAVGWYMEQYRQAQVSINLTNFKLTPPHVVYDVIRSEAEKRGLLVTGSELVGLIPLEAMRMAGRHYLRKQGRSPGVSDEELVTMAVRSLGLDQIASFDPQQKIIEYRFRKAQGRLVSMPLRAFADLTASDVPAPGGGSVSAAGGALAAALVAMVCNLTANGLGDHQRRGSEGSEHFNTLVKVAGHAQSLKDQFLLAVDCDTDAFYALMDAMRVKTATPQEADQKARRVREAMKGAIRVPLDTMRGARDLLTLARTAALRGNPNALSDAGVAGALALAVAQGAWYNVCINLKHLDDAPYVIEIRREAEALLAEVRELAGEVEKLMDGIVLASAAPDVAATGNPVLK